MFLNNILNPFDVGVKFDVCLNYIFQLQNWRRNQKNPKSSIKKLFYHSYEMFLDLASVLTTDFTYDAYNSLL